VRHYIQPVAERLGIQKRIGWHTSPYLLHITQKSRSRIQSYAGADEAFLAALYARRVHSGGWPSEAGRARRNAFAVRSAAGFGETSRKPLILFGLPDGIRTRVIAVKSAENTTVRKHKRGKPSERIPSMIETVKRGPQKVHSFDGSQLITADRESTQQIQSI
jgi:hypothetical protein